MRLFQVVRGLQQRPNPKNQALHHFLTLMWEAATGERDVSDWTAPLQTARAKRFPKGAEVALIYARKAAGDLGSGLNNASLIDLPWSHHAIHKIRMLKFQRVSAN